MRSFRAQVTVWIGGAFVVLIVSIIFAIGSLNLNRISQNIDRDLEARARMLTDPNRPPIRPRFNGQQPPPDFGFGGEEASKIGAIRRPRIIAPDRSMIGGTEIDAPFDEDALSQALNGTRMFSQRRFADSEIRILTVPAIREGRVHYVVQVARELKDLYEVRDIQGSLLAIFLPCGLLLIGIVTWFLLGKVMKPIRALGVAADELGSGDFSKRIKVAGSDEFATLGERFNTMASNIETSMQSLERALQQQKQFTADASHELRTPLTRILMATDSPPSSIQDAEEAMTTTHDAAKDMSKLVNQLLILSQFESSNLQQEFRLLDLRLSVSQAVQKVQDSGVLVEVKMPQQAVTILGSDDLIERSVINILENARKYGEPSRAIDVSLITENEAAILTIRDLGEGVPADSLSRLTERFYRVDTARSRETGGTGLGLSIVQETVSAHGGELKISCPPEGGLKVEMWIPLARP